MIEPSNCQRMGFKNNRFNQEWKLRADVLLAKLLQLTHISALRMFMIIIAIVGWDNINQPTKGL